MPFTPSHAIVALPFVRTPLVPAAIAIGAMTPDLPLFVRVAPLSYQWTHDLLFLPVTILVALILLLVWRCALRPAVRELAPEPIARRLPSAWDDRVAAGLRETLPSVGGAVLTVVSLGIGIASHIVWDLFTHVGRAGIPALDAPWGPLPGHTWLQRGSGVVGVVVLVVAAIVWLRRTAPGPGVNRVLPRAVRIAWWLSLPILLIGAATAGYVAFGPFRGDFGPEHLAYAVLPPACAVWGVLTLVLCLIVQGVRGPVESAEKQP